MIQNREQLIQAATEWTNMAKEDLTNKLVEFTEATGASKEELSDVLAIPVSEIEAILNGRGNVSLSTFAKLIIATDNVLEIKPLAESPFANYGEIPNPSRMPLHRPNGCVRRIPNDPIPPHIGSMSRMPRQGSRRPQEPRGVMAEMECQRDMFERTRRSTLPSVEQPLHRPIPVPFGDNPNPQMVEADLDELGKRELMGIISQNGWAREIDFNTTSRSGLIDFIKYKDSMKPKNEETSEVTDSEVDRITEMIKEEVKRNPQLRSVVKKYLK